ncbi:MAG: nucleotidyl transferase AbiEii/AbiGii toxin family protein [Patescibacteria group bacterium]|nr:nucleotidyl transferase AbiEii/AbiGii toxin family protein [Patescibacteria group bacterium]
MISVDFLKKLANKHQTTELNIRREYIQHLFLSYFYQRPEADKIYFKGGTALRVVYGSPRFSEDLDFSSSYKQIRPIENAVIDSLREIEREGIDTEIVESKKTSGGYLAIINFRISGEKVSTQLEISLRGKKEKGEVVSIVGDFTPPYTILVLEKEQLVGEKIQALLFRQKPRDFYDLYFILRANFLPAREKNILPLVLKILHESKTNFEQELKQFLPKSQWAIILEFRKALEKEIIKFK